MAKPNLGYLLFLIVLICGACTQAPSEIKTIRYFDIPAFFESQVALLENSGTMELKVLKTANEQETISVKPKSWKEELAIFSKINLNKSSYIGKYSVDTVISRNGIIVSYNAKEDKLPVKHCSYETQSDSILWIQMRKEDKSIVLNSELFWRFVPDSGYFVSGSQQIGNLSPSVYEVSVIFAN